MLKGLSGAPTLGCLARLGGFIIDHRVCSNLYETYDSSPIDVLRTSDSGLCVLRYITIL